MKLNKKLLSLTTLGMLMIGCSHDLLEQSPNAVESDAEFYKTEEQIADAVIGVYDVASWYSQESTLMWIDGASDDATNEDNGWGPFVDQIEAFEYLNTAPEIDVLWGEMYQGIYRANKLIQGVTEKGGGVDPIITNRAIAEAKFLRGHFYFTLLKVYGSVPLFTTPPAAGEYCKPASPAADVWAQIEQDFTDAAVHLPTKSQESTGRATKGAALSYLAKAHLFQGDYAGVKAATDQVITSGEYSLHTNYGDNFAYANENGVESVFELQYTTLQIGEWGNGNEGQVMTQFQGPTGIGAEYTWWGYNIPEQNLLTAFGTDPRLQETIVQEGEVLLPEEGAYAALIFDDGDDLTNRLSPKKMLPKRRGLILTDNSQHEENIKIIRYSDVLLMDAEAENELGNMADAVASLNLVQARAGVPLSAASTLAEMRTTIWNERRLELALEGHRYFDIIRQDNNHPTLNRAATIFADKPSYKENKKYLPYPQSEIDMCAGILVQNAYLSN